MAAALRPASGTKTPTRHGEVFAEQTVGATFAAAGLGLLVGDASTVAAIMRPDYATGPGLAFPLESLQALALCLRHGIVIRNPLALAQIATADVLLLDHHPALEHAELELDSVEVFPASTEERVLGYAAAALRGLDDERAAALERVCRDRGMNPADLPLVELAPDLTMQDGGDCIKVGELGDRARPSSSRGRSSDGRAGNGERGESLMVGINGRVAGLVHFRRSTRLAAGQALQALCGAGKHSDWFGLGRSAGGGGSTGSGAGMRFPPRRPDYFGSTALLASLPEAWIPHGVRGRLSS